MIRTFKGNFGELTLNIDGIKASGSYQKDGIVEGDFTNNTFTGTWNNKGLEGLVEFKIKENVLNGNWKKGLEPGTMKGKWYGEEIKPTEEPANETTFLNEPISVMKFFAKLDDTPENNLACSFAAVIRHFILVDGKVDQEEHNLLSEALEHYDNISIPTSEVWDEVDDAMQTYEFLGLQGKIIMKATEILSTAAEHDEKNYLLQLLTRIVAADEVVTFEEYEGLSSLAESFYSGSTPTLNNNLKNLGIEINF